MTWLSGAASAEREGLQARTSASKSIQKLASDVGQQLSHGLARTKVRLQPNDIGK